MIVANLLNLNIKRKMIIKMKKQGNFVMQQRTEHQNNPEVFFTELLNNLWSSRTEEQSIWEWNRLCTLVRWYAEDALECFEKIIKHPPSNLVELMQDEGCILLDHGTANYTVLRMYKKKYEEFLNSKHQKFKEIFESTNTEVNH